MTSQNAGSHRLLEVTPERLPRWVTGFVDRHGPSTTVVAGDEVLLTAEDGSTASLEVPWPPAHLDGDPVERLAAHAAAPRTSLIVLVRRGGFAAGTCRDGRLVEHRTGNRYVQGRTAAGGWSQQRFARRRSGQASALEQAAVDAVLAVLGRAAEPVDVVTVGGDRTLVASVLDDPRLQRVASLPRGPLLHVPDPRLSVLQDVAGRTRAVRVRLTEPG